jgi:hypothetical protein
MTNLIPLPDPPCGAALPDGSSCPAASTAVVTAEHPAGRVLLAWTCPDHIAPSVEASVRSCPDAIVAVTPLALAS